MDDDRIDRLLAEVVHDDGRVAVVVGGEFDLATAPVSRAALEAAMSDAGRPGDRP